MKFKTCKDSKTMVEIFCACRMPQKKVENNVFPKKWLSAVNVVKGFTEYAN